MKLITSEKNQWIKTVSSLKQKKTREELGLFVIEGIRFAAEIPNNWKVRFFLLTQSYEKGDEYKNWENIADTFVVPDELFLKISNTVSPQGILAVCEQKKLNWAEFLKQERKNCLYLLAEEINDPGNLGTMIRTADACGADAIFLSNGCADLYNPKTLRATMGSIFHLPIFQEVDFKKLCKMLKENACSLYAAHLQGQDYPYHFDLKKSTAFLIGNEAHGLSDDIAEDCNFFIRIPMLGKAESLNASVAASVLLYEAVRQRISL